MKKIDCAIHDDDFQEDMGMKVRWIREFRGDQTEQEVSDNIAAAIEHIKKNKNSRFSFSEPNGSSLEQDALILGDEPSLTVEEVSNPKRTDSENFVSDCFYVHSKQPYCDASLRLRPKRGTQKKYELSTTKVFMFDEKMRRWNLIEDSGYSSKNNFIWCNVFRVGIYVAIALPNNQTEIRKLAICRFSYLGMRLGHEAKLIHCAKDYFDEGVFEEIVKLAIDPDLKKEEKDQLLTLSKNLHEESQLLAPDWPQRFPSNGLPEWQILEFMDVQNPERLVDYQIADAVSGFIYFPPLIDRVGRWYSHGPWNINGRIKSIVIHPTSSSVLYAGSAQGGVWKTTNRGETWRHQWKFESSLSIGSLAISQSDPTILYAATGEQTGGRTSANGGGIFKTTNSGDSWFNVTDKSLVGATCAKIVIHPTDPDTVYVASINGLFGTRDGGALWITLFPNSETTDVVIDAQNPEILFLGVRDDGIYKSTNSGRNWSRIQGDLFRDFGVLPFFQPPFPTGDEAGWIKLAISQYGENLLVAKMGQDGETMVMTFNGDDF